jgi:hypothetical protein
MAPGAAAIGVDNGTVLVLITVVVLPIAAVAFARSGSAWRGIGKGAFGIDRESPEGRPREGTPAERALQETEARQMLEARSYRRQRRGEAPLDVEAEVRRVLDSHASAVSVDDELRAEVRHLVIAANERRQRRGEEPLDVEAETERQLAQIS